MSWADLAQWQILLGGALSVTLISTVGNRRAQLAGYCIGLFNQWAWHYSAVTAEPFQFGVFIINLFYGFNYVRALLRIRKGES